MRQEVNILGWRWSPSVADRDVTANSHVLDLSPGRGRESTAKQKLQDSMSGGAWRLEEGGGIRG